MSECGHISEHVRNNGMYEQLSLLFGTEFYLNIFELKKSRRGHKLWLTMGGKLWFFYVFLGRPHWYVISWQSRYSIECIRVVWKQKNSVQDKKNMNGFLK